MKIITEDSLNHFNFWSGGADRADVLTEEQMDQVEEALELEYPDGIEDGTLNDLFWFEEDYIAGLCGFSSFAALEKFNEHGEQYVVRLDHWRENIGDDIGDEFETLEEAEAWVNNVMQDTDEFKEYCEKYQVETVDVYICSTLKEDDYEINITLDNPNFTEEDEDE